MKIRLAVVALTAAGGLLGAGLSTPAEAAKAKSYKNCKALNKVYKHGVGKKGAKDKTSGKAVKNFKVSTKIYKLNDGKNRRAGEKDLDRDNDGIACEKR